MYLKMLLGEQILEKGVKTVALEIWTSQPNEFRAKLYFLVYCSIRKRTLHGTHVSANAAG
jgi:hypothetical protein